MAPLRHLFLVVLAGALLVLPAPGAADPAPPGLPSHVPEQTRTRLQEITEHPTVSTRVESEPFAGRVDVFEYLLDHPEFATHVTRTLKLARYRIWQTADGLVIDDGWGTVGTFEVVHAAPGIRVMHAQGEYQHWILPSIRGQAVVQVDYTASAGGGSGPAIQTGVTGFVKLDSRLLSLAGKLARAVANAKADREGRQLVKMFARTARAIDEDPAGVYALLRQKSDVPLRELEQFRRLLKLPAPAGPAAAR
ncbi:MAG TPA: hypothetical protein VMR23_15615 [Candidatus Limnocylindria bacterium]|nr:hypothetical protein [Candidatus Limnocylindria bacterium]